MPSLSTLVSVLLLAFAAAAGPIRPAPLDGIGQLQQRPGRESRIVSLTHQTRKARGQSNGCTIGVCTDPTAWFAHFDLTGQKISYTEQKIVNASTTSILKNFPGAMPSQQLVPRIKMKLAEYGYGQDNTLFGTSLCPDEICHEQYDLPNLLSRVYSKRAGGFKLSGLGGVPFTGKTGFAAFAHHVPTNGHVLVMFAPHVAISPDGEVGRYQRDGQKGLSTACGACIGALNAVEAEDGLNTLTGRLPDGDYQMQTIVQHVRERFAEIGAHPSGKMVGLILEVYELARIRMLAMIDLGQLNGGQLALLGGVQINMPAPMQDFFLPLSFEMHRQGKAVVDMLPSVLPELDSLSSRRLLLPSLLRWRPPSSVFRTSQQVLHQLADVQQREAGDGGGGGSRDAFLFGRRLGQASVDDTAWGAHLELTGFPPTERDRAVIASATASVRTHFPGAVVSEALASKMERVLAEYGYDQENTLFGSSLCPDEICHEAGDLPDLLSNYYSAEFSLSGLGGVPFTGKTGFAAFAHHVPKNGHVLVVFAPHVAISPDGQVGRCMRDGQSGLSSACGACIGALNAVEAENGLHGAGGLTEADYQMQTIVQHVRERFATIGTHPSGKTVGLILEVYELARVRMLAMADLGQLDGGQLALLGGVQINMPRPMEDFFLPLSFELRREGMKPRNLLPELTKDEAAAIVRPARRLRSERRHQP